MLASCLPLVDSQQSVGAKLDDVLAQVDALLVLQCLRVPLMQTGRQQNRLPSVDGQPDLTLRNLKSTCYRLTILYMVNMHLKTERDPLN